MSRLDEIEARLAADQYTSEGYDYRDPSDDLRYLLKVARAAEALAIASRDGLNATSGLWVPLRAALGAKS